VKKVALPALALWLFAAAGLAAAQVDLTNFVQTGMATGEMPGAGLLAAHPTLPVGSMPTIRSVGTGREVTVVVARRIPASAERVIDLSAAAAQAIGLDPGGYVAVFFSANAAPPVSAPPPPAQPATTTQRMQSSGASIVIRNNVAQMPGASVTVFNHILIEEARRAAAERRAALIAREIERLGIQDVFVRVVDEGVMLSLEDIQFEANSAALLSGEREKVYRIAAVLRLFPRYEILVSGHTWYIGNRVAAHRLSMDRAGTVANYLANLNIRADRILTRGYGNDRPIADGATLAGQRRNRRVEITLLDR